MHITTQRLALRELRASDLDGLFALFGDAVYRQFEGGPLSREETRAELEKFIGWGQAQPRTRYAMAVVVPPDDVMMGTIHLRQLNDDIREWEIGWGMNRACWGQGYAPEAAREMLRFAFGELKAHRVTAFCHADNAASVRVMEKIGLRREGRLKQVRWLNGQWWDEYVYAMVEEDFISV